jgi:signal-transduction protein with cAMP-binding, CBS, and nucleotidyltransferase domain
MTTNVCKIRGSATVAEAVKSMKARGIRALIVDRSHPQDAYGIVTETDIVQKVVAYGKDPQKIRVYEVMTKPCIVVNPDLGVEYAARLFTQTGIRCAPVIKDELIGIISISDILNKSDFLENPKEVFFEQEIQKAIAEAKKICSDKGHTSQECRQSWDRVEALQADAAYQGSMKLEKTALEEYLEEYPEASELLDNWCSG